MPWSIRTNKSRARFKKGYIIIFRCKKCGAIRRNKAAKDDNIDLLIKLTASQ